MPFPRTFPIASSISIALSLITLDRRAQMTGPACSSAIFHKNLPAQRGTPDCGRCTLDAGPNKLESKARAAGTLARPDESHLPLGALLPRTTVRVGIQLLYCRPVLAIALGSLTDLRSPSRSDTPCCKFAPPQREPERG